jgi:hypothetical protein
VFAGFAVCLLAYPFVFGKRPVLRFLKKGKAAAA